jgi:hypothetical protein
MSQSDQVLYRVRGPTPLNNPKVVILEIFSLNEGFLILVAYRMIE